MCSYSLTNVRGWVHLISVLLSIILFSHFIQILTTLDLFNNRIGDRGLQYLSDALQNNEVGKQLSQQSLNFTDFIRYRYWPHWLSEAIKSAKRGCNIWVMCYETVKWDRYSSSIQSIFSHITQTLTTLDLFNNHIGEKGMKHLSDALRDNTVREHLHSFLALQPLLSYRHWLHLTYQSIKLGIEDCNI